MECKRIVRISQRWAGITLKRWRNTSHRRVRIITNKIILLIVI